VTFGANHFWGRIEDFIWVKQQQNYDFEGASDFKTF
jgi:hypothetical protein